MRQRQEGFTLVELMIVVAIIAILASIAIPAYNDYIKEARMAKVSEHYDAAVRIIRSHAAKIAAIQARGGSDTLPGSAAEWISDVIDPDGKAKAPQGGVAGYSVAGPDNVNGVIGIAWAANVVAIGRPAYIDISSILYTIDTDEV